MTYQNESGKYQLQIQTDYRWAKERMATDYELFRDYGCLVTALTNIINMKQGSSYLVIDVIKRIRNLKLFAGDRYPNTPEQQKSFLLTDDFLGTFQLRRQEVSGFIEGKYHYCRVMVKLARGGWIGHFTNLFQIHGQLFIFDVYDGTFVKATEKMITNYYIVEAL